MGSDKFDAMFSIFKKNNQPKFRDKVWKTRDIAWKQIVMEAMQAIMASETPVICIFFPETFRQFNAYLASLNVPFQLLEPGARMEFSDKVVFIASASFLENGELPELVQRHSTHKMRFLFLGHYPLPLRENNLTSKLISKFGAERSITFWVSLEDPLMKTFGSDRILPLLETLGVKEDECIEHDIVSKSIKNAREKIGKSVISEVEADTEQAWFDKNFKKV